MEVKSFCQRQETVGLGLTRELKSDWLPHLLRLAIYNRIMQQRAPPTSCSTYTRCVHARTFKAFEGFECMQYDC